MRAGRRSTTRPYRSRLLALVLCALLVVPLGGVPAVSASTPASGMPAGDGWVWQNPLPTGTMLNAVHFADATNGWAVGAFGTILKTTDAGATWTVQTSGTSTALTAVHFVNATTGWAVGYGGTILKTTDGGATWTAQSSGTTCILRSVHFVNATTGWVVGGGPSTTAVLKTTDGGANWDDQTPWDLIIYRGVHFVDENTGWVVGDTDTIYRTTDGGATWIHRGAYQVPSGWKSAHLNAVHFVDAATGWAVGDSGHRWWSTDGGVSWELRGWNATHSYRCIHFADANTGWMVDSWGRIRTTTNGGQTWSTHDSGMGQLSSVHFADANNGCVVGPRGAILTTSNGGGEWNQRSGFAITKHNLWGVHFLDANTGWAVGDAGTILKTEDAGDTWIAQSAGAEGSFEAVYFVDADTGWVVGDVWGDDFDYGILKTEDGGATWVAHDLGAEDWLLAVYFLDAERGWAVGEGGTIFKTTDGGSTWTSHASGTGAWLSDVRFVSAAVGWVVGGGGTILKTADGGASWLAQTSGTSASLLAVHFLDANTGWAVGGGGTILKTVSGGITWTPQASGTSEGLAFVSFTDLLNGCAVGETGTVLKTTDGGSSWSVRSAGSTATNLRGFYFLDTDTGWAVGDGGAILRYGEVELLPSIDIQHDAAGVTFDRWVTGYSTAYSGGGYVYGRWTGTELTARFTGNTIRWVGPKQPSYGMADVYIDGVLVAENVDCYAPAGSATLDAVIWESGTLTDGPHTITLKLKGNRNASSTGNVVVLDRFEVDGAAPKGGGTRIDDAAAAPGYTGNWISAINPTYYDKTYSYSRWAGHVFSVTFEGTKVAWLGPMTPFYGKAEIWLDGAYVTTVDAYRDYQGWRERIWESETLSPGMHTLEIRPTGEKNPASTSANVVVDAIDVTE